QSNVLLRVLDAQSVFFVVPVTHRMEFQDLSEAGVETAVYGLEPTVGIGAPGAAARIVGAAVDGEAVVGSGRADADIDAGGTTMYPADTAQHQGVTRTDH